MTRSRWDSNRLSKKGTADKGGGTVEGVKGSSTVLLITS